MTVFQIRGGATVLCICTVLSMWIRSVCKIPKAVRSSAVVNTNPSRRHVSCVTSLGQASCLTDSFTAVTDKGGIAFLKELAASTGKLSFQTLPFKAAPTIS